MRIKAARRRYSLAQLLVGAAFFVATGIPGKICILLSIDFREREIVEQVLLILLAAGLLPLGRPRSRGSLLVPYAGFAVFASLSTLWSLNPEATISGIARLLLILVLGAAVARASSARMFVRTAGGVLSAALLATFAAVLLDLPAVSFPNGAIRGLFPARVTFGHLSGIALILGAAASRYKLANRVRNRFLIGCGITGLILSRVAFAAILSGVGLFSLALYANGPATKRHMLKWILALVAVGALAVFWRLGILHISPARFALSLNGRILLWKSILETLGPYRLFGSGYMAFWSSPLGAAVRHQIPWTHGWTDNGYLWIFEELGIGGLLLVLWCGVSAVRTFKAAGRINTASGALFRAYLPFFALQNLMGAWIFTPDFLWLLMLIAFQHFADRAARPSTGTPLSPRRSI